MHNERFFLLPGADQKDIIIRLVPLTLSFQKCQKFPLTFGPSFRRRTEHVMCTLIFSFVQLTINATFFHDSRRSSDL